MQIVRIILIFSVFAVQLTGYAQNADSLRQQANKTVPDTSSVLACYEIAADLWYEDVREAEVFAQKGLEIAESLEWERGIAMMKKNLAAIASIKGDYARSLLFNNQALRFYKEVGDTVSVGKIYNNMAITYADLGFLWLSRRWANYKLLRNSNDWSLF